MRARHWLAAAALALLGSAPALPQETSGSEMPEVVPTEWLNQDGRTSLADYRGEVVLVVSFATW